MERESDEQQTAGDEHSSPLSMQVAGTRDQASHAGPQMGGS